MKTYVVIENDHFLRFLELQKLAKSEESFQRFLSEIGATKLSFTKPMEASIAVPTGSCIRLHTPESYGKYVEENLLKQEQIQPEPIQTKTETHPRTNSCSIQ